MKKLNSREEKIAFLKSLAAGRSSIDDLCEIPERWDAWFEMPERNENGEKLFAMSDPNAPTQQEKYVKPFLTRDEVWERYKNKKRTHVLYVCYEGNATKAPITSEKEAIERYSA